MDFNRSQCSSPHLHAERVVRCCRLAHLHLQLTPQLRHTRQLQQQHSRVGEVVHTCQHVKLLCVEEGKSEQSPNDVAADGGGKSRGEKDELVWGPCETKNKCLLAGISHHNTGSHPPPC
mgnify:CR=1 FL=1